MSENEVLVTEQVTENVEQTTEETPKMFTQEEVNEIVGKAKARTKAKIEKDYQRRYGELVGVLRAGTGKESAEEQAAMFRDFYQKRGIPMPQKPTYSDKDIEVLANAEAEDIIRSGFEDVVEEVDRLADIGIDNMTAREKAVFRKLAEHRQNAERGNELKKIGVGEDVYASEDFRQFATMFDSKTPISKVYEVYAQTKPKKEHKTMGSMKTTGGTDSGVKDFYTPEEARKFTKADFDRDPALFKAVEASMLKWR